MQKCKGVTWHKRDKRYEARIRVNGRLYNLGGFKRFEDAANARKAAEIRLGVEDRYVEAIPPEQEELNEFIGLRATVELLLQQNAALRAQIDKLNQPALR